MYDTLFVCLFPVANGALFVQKNYYGSGLWYVVNVCQCVVYM